VSAPKACGYCISGPVVHARSFGEYVAKFSSQPHIDRPDDVCQPVCKPSAGLGHGADIVPYLATGTLIVWRG